MFLANPEATWNAMGYASASASASALRTPPGLRSFSKAELRDLFKLARPPRDPWTRCGRGAIDRAAGGAAGDPGTLAAVRGGGAESGRPAPPPPRLALGGGGRLSAVCKLPSAARAGGGEAT